MAGPVQRTTLCSEPGGWGAAARNTEFTTCLIWMLLVVACSETLYYCQIFYNVPAIQSGDPQRRAYPTVDKSCIEDTDIYMWIATSHVWVWKKCHRFMLMWHLSDMIGDSRKQSKNKQKLKSRSKMITLRLWECFLEIIHYKYFQSMMQECWKMWWYAMCCWARMESGIGDLEERHSTQGIVPYTRLPDNRCLNKERPRTEISEGLKSLTKKEGKNEMTPSKPGQDTSLRLY